MNLCLSPCMKSYGSLTTSYKLLLASKGLKDPEEATGPCCRLS